jgi:Holliday junction resolvase RusA-like endonuclease
MTTETITITVAGTPTPKGRARSTRTGRHYTPETTRVAENAVAATWYQTVGIDREPHIGPVEITIVSTFAPPKSWAKWKRAAALAGEIPHTTKPDADNLLKLIKDGLHGAAYRDDAQAFRVGARKQYGITAGTTVTLIFHPTTEHRKQPKRRDI